MTTEDDDTRKKDLIKRLRSTNISMHTFPLLAELEGYAPGTLFWKWIVPGDESLFKSKSFAENCPDISTTIADTVDQALINWLGGAPIPTVLEDINKAIAEVQDIVNVEDQTSDRLNQLTPLTDPDEMESLSRAAMLLESLNDLRNVVGDMSSRASVLRAVGDLRDLLYPQISKSNPNDRPLGRG